MAISISLLIALVAVVVNFLIGFYGKTRRVATRRSDNVKWVTPVHYTRVVKIPIRTRVIQITILVLLAAALCWAVLPIVEWFGEEGANVFIFPLIVPVAFQYAVLNPVIQWASELSVAHLSDADIPVVKGSVPAEPKKTCVVTRRW
jgi:hypothetical protein